MKWSLVKGFQPISLSDWPSKISSVIFLGGCNFRCPTCHNWQLAFYPEKYPSISIHDIFSYLHQKKNWIDGVVISGGEPTLFPHLTDLTFELKNRGFCLKLDTNGSNPEKIEELLAGNLVDLFAVDIKGPFEKYPKLTGGKISEKTIRENFSKIFSLAKTYPTRFIFRTTLVPFLTQEDITIIKAYLPQGFELTLQEYKEINQEVA